MPRDTINDLQAFLAVAREQSFTKAATKLGVSQSALSHTVRGLEAQPGVRLLTRTTRSVAPTPAGERVLATMGPLLDEIEAGMAALSEFRDKPAGPSASRRASTPSIRSSGPHWSGCCRTTRTSRWNWTSTMA